MKIHQCVVWNECWVSMKNGWNQTVFECKYLHLLKCWVHFWKVEWANWENVESIFMLTSKGFFLQFYRADSNMKIFSISMIAKKGWRSSLNTHKRVEFHLKKIWWLKSLKNQRCIKTKKTYKH